MKPKYPLPWRERQRAKAEKKNKVIEWCKKSWPYMTAGAVLVGWILQNLVTVLQNAEQLPAAYSKTRDSLLSRYYDDESWTGVWSSSPEGYVDSGDVRLSDTNILLQVQTGQGKVDGTIGTPTLCKALPFASDGVLFRGHVSGDKIIGIAYDYIGGKEAKIALLIIQRDTADRSLLTIVPQEDELQAFPTTATIRLHPGDKPMDVSKSSSFCDQYRYPSGRPSKSKKRKPIHELTRSASD